MKKFNPKTPRSIKDHLVLAAKIQRYDEIYTVKIGRKITKSPNRS